MQDMVAAIHQLSYRHSTSKIFSDFVEVSAIAFSNTVDKKHFEEREKRYFDILKQYTKEEFNIFPKLLGMLVKHLTAAPKDVLGDVFHELELHNERKGQFFTPFPLCQMMAKVTIGDNPQSIIDQKGFITVSEPSCGTGAMVIAAATELQYQGVNYQQNLYVSATDLDVTCVHAAYVQFSLLNIPATLIHGDTLTLKEYSQWHTPAHILGFWGQKIERSQNQKILKEFISSSPAPEAAKPEIKPKDNIPERPKNQKNVGTQLNIF